MDGRWVLLTLVVAVIAAIRLHRRAPEQDTKPTGTTGRSTPPPVPASEDRGPTPGPATSMVSRDEVRSEGGTVGEQVGNGDEGDEGANGDEGDPQEAVFDLEAVGAALERVWAEHAHDADLILDSRLRQLVARKVPVRAIRRAPGGRAVRVAFADGTVVLCRGTGQGDFGRLGLALQRHSVRLASFGHVEDVTRLEFSWNPGQRLRAVAVGLDQPD